MKLFENDTVIVTLLTLALFSFVKSLEAAPLDAPGHSPQAAIIVGTG
jgi:hypothetical protein